MEIMERDRIYKQLTEQNKSNLEKVIFKMNQSFRIPSNAEEVYPNNYQTIISPQACVKNLFSQVFEDVVDILDPEMNLESEDEDDEFPEEMTESMEEEGEQEGSEGSKETESGSKDSQE